MIDLLVEMAIYKNVSHYFGLSTWQSLSRMGIFLHLPSGSAEAKVLMLSPEKAHFVS